MKRILFLITALIAFVSAPGCAQLAKDGPYKGDAVLFHADEVIVSSYKVLHGFVKWEYDNRATLSNSPQIKQYADMVRRNAERWINSAQVTRDAYVATPTPEMKTLLQRSIETLSVAMTEVSKYVN